MLFSLAVDLTQPATARAIFLAVRRVWNSTYPVRKEIGTIVDKRDLTQMSLWAVWNRAKDLGRDLDPPEVYLTARWASLKAINRENDWEKTQRAGFTRVNLDSIDPNSDHSLAFSTPDRTEEVEQQAYRTQMLEVIEELRLPPRERQVLEALRRDPDRGWRNRLTVEMGISWTNVHRAYACLLRRARNRLRDRWTHRTYTSQVDFPEGVGMHPGGGTGDVSLPASERIHPPRFTRKRTDP